MTPFFIIGFKINKVKKMKNMEIDNFTPQERQWLQSACLMGREAGEALKHYFRRRDLNIEDKGSAYDIVTEADKASERIIIDHLHSQYPDHAILSEESGDDHRHAQCQWVIDPLDGTVNYSAGLATYCISIGLKVDGETRMGYVYAPTLDEEFYAIRGKGSYGPYGRLSAKDTTELQRAVVSTGFPYDKARQQPGPLCPGHAACEGNQTVGVGSDGPVLRCRRMARCLLGTEPQGVGCLCR